MGQYQRRNYEYTQYDPTKVGGYSGENGVSTKKSSAQGAYDTWVQSGFSASDKLTGAGTNKTNAQNAYDKWVQDGYVMSDEVIYAGADKEAAENAVKGYGDFSYSKSDIFNQTMDKILNREKFSYDVNGDALYQQYKDKYIQQGKMAMANTMGQAAAMTGGYGSSYSASVGNQAYQASLQQLNDVIPELYKMAYDRYNQEGQDLYNQYGMLSDDRSTEYGMWNDGYNKLVNDRAYYSDNFNTTYDRDYGQHMDKGNILGGNRDYWTGEESNLYNREYGAHMDKGNILSGERDYWTGEEGTLYDRGYNEHINTENSKSKAIDDENAYNKWEAETEIQERQFQQANKPSSTPTPNKPSLSPSEYNEIMGNSESYAAQGEGSLANYLNGLVSRGYIGQDEAADIFEQYFPTKIPTGGKGGGGGLKGGGGSKVEYVLN